MSIQTFLYGVAAMALDGSTSVLHQSNLLPAVPLPLDARRFLRHLRDKRFESLEAIQAGLKPLQEAAPEVSRLNRAGNILCHAGIYLLMTVAALFVMRLDARSVSEYPDANRFYHAIRELDNRAGSQDKAALETYIAGRFRQVYLDRSSWAQTLMGMNFDRRLATRAGQVFGKAAPSEAEVRAAEIRIAKFRQFLDDDIVRTTSVLEQVAGVIIIPMTALAVVDLVAMLVAFISGGPGVATLFGIALVMHDGTEVSRGRALFRSFVSSVPPLASTAAAFLSLDRNHYELATTIVLSSFVVLSAGAAFAILRPERGLQDHIAGTALVPRPKV